MDEPIVAHLNGGPHDGEISVLPPGRMIYSLPTGVYDARLDANGHVVPHENTRTLEYDWKPD